MKDIEIAKRFVRKQNDAHKRNIDFDLTFSEFKKLMTRKRCFFTNEILTDGSDIDNDNKRSIDRLDNTVGYISGNVVACTVKINKAKASLTPQQVKQIFTGLQKKNII